LLIASINRPADKFRRIVGHAQGCADGKNLIEDSLCGNELGDLMRALFLRHCDQRNGALTLPRSIAGTDRSRYISKGDLHEIVD
jgi:hypothetical protein